MPNDLWAGMRIPIILISGPVFSGKTLQLLTIDPNCRRPASEVEPTTLMYDQEGSAESYVDALNFVWKDTRAAVAAGVHREIVAPDANDPRWLQILKKQADCNDSPAASMFRAWYLSLLKVPTGKYLVGGCDTWTPLEAGAVDWLRRHPEAFGRTINEYTKASSMFLWPDLKAMLAHILTIDCRLRFQTFVLNVHLKNEWSGGSKTGKQVAEGLDILEKLATLHLELDRSPKANGKEAPRVPAAIVKKCRLVRFSADGNDMPILPPRIPECTPDAIRKYIATPPDYSKLTPGERLPDQSMSDDDKLRLQASIAENNRVTEESRLSALEMARQAMQQGRTVTVTATTTTSQPAATETAPVTGNGQLDGPAQTSVTPASTSTPITKQQLDEMLGLMKKLFATGLDAVNWLQGAYEVNNPAGLTSEQATNVLIELNKKLADKTLAEAGQVAPTAPEVQQDGPATTEQRTQIRDLTISIFGDQAPQAQTAFLQSLGLASGDQLKYSQAQQRILELDQRSKDGIPF